MSSPEGSGSFEAWIERQYRHCAVEMLRSVSPTTLEKTRPMFGQHIRAHRGAIVASPVLGAYDPEPDYFFHWYRDSALVVDALRLLLEEGRVALDTRPALLDFVRFSASLSALDGAAAAVPPLAHITPDFRGFLRPSEELAQVRGESVALETRVNPDGTLDILRWARPQYDGPALRALMLLRWWYSERLDAGDRAELTALLKSDLAIVHRWAGRPCFDLWEEEQALHYYTLRVSAAALEEGAAWLEQGIDSVHARDYRAQARGLLETLDGFWDPIREIYRSRLGGEERKALDIAVPLGVVHSASGARGRAERTESRRHSVDDPKVHRTLDALERLFAHRYAINQGRPADRGPAMGRYEGDVYYAGGAYFFSTLGAAELCFRTAGMDPEGNHWRARGDAFLRTVRDFTPPSGDLAEQFDQHTGEPASARHLAWSYAAFISCVAARDAAYRGLAASQ